MSRVVVIGAGAGGLTTAALLARAGLDVTVLEAHVYPGGCAGTFYHRGYRFDAGATLAGGFYPGGPMDIVAQAAGIEAWPAREANPAMSVLLPDRARITRWADERRHAERREVFGPAADSFWQWQESTADALWDFALRAPAWPPQTMKDAASLAGKGLGWLKDDLRGRLRPSLVLDAIRPASAHLNGASDRLRLFIDGQLLIAAQTTSRAANALYSASALDLPRRGVVHLVGGMGAIAQTLAEAVRRHGGRVLTRQEVTRIETSGGVPTRVLTKRKDFFPADVVIANLPPWDIARLLGEHPVGRLRNLPPLPEDGWGAFMVYLGVDGSLIPSSMPLHHQVIVREPLAEANSIFMSISPAWDDGRAPAGHRAITFSTHTNLARWWELFNTNRDAYGALKEQVAYRVLAGAERLLPGLRDAAALTLPGTPVTFQRFTRRTLGWVGGFPQTSLFRAWGPRLAPGLWMVGDSIFPGQSVAAAALGGLRVAGSILGEHGIKAENLIPAPGQGAAV